MIDHLLMMIGQQRSIATKLNVIQLIDVMIFQNLNVV